MRRKDPREPRSGVFGTHGLCEDGCTWGPWVPAASDVEGCVAGVSGGIWQLAHGRGTMTSVSMGRAWSHEATLGGLADLAGKGVPWEGETTDTEAEGESLPAKGHEKDDRPGGERARGLLHGLQINP